MSYCHLKVQMNFKMNFKLLTKQETLFEFHLSVRTRRRLMIAIPEMLKLLVNLKARRQLNTIAHTHIRSRHKDEIIASISHSFLSEQDYITASFWCLPGRLSPRVWESFYDVLLESLDSNSCRCKIQALFYRDDFAKWFTSKRCPSPQKNILCPPI